VKDVPVIVAVSVEARPLSIVTVGLIGLPTSTLKLTTAIVSITPDELPDPSRGVTPLPPWELRLITELACARVVALAGATGAPTPITTSVNPANTDAKLPRARRPPTPYRFAKKYWRPRR
jgi:hypothetical protein